MKLNVGASDPRGRYRGPEWVNVDYSRFFRGQRFHRFAVANGCQLPFRDGTFDEVHAIHVLEHVPRKRKLPDGTEEDAHLAFVKEIGRVLTPEGFGFIEVPDFVRCCRLIVDAADELDDLEEEFCDPHSWGRYVEAIRVRTVGVYGKGRHEGDWHHWGFSSFGLESLFKNARLMYCRESEMISAHHRLEPVLLYRVWREGDPRSR